MPYSGTNVPVFDTNLHYLGSFFKDESNKLYFEGCYADADAKSSQSCLTLCDPIDGSPQGPAVPGMTEPVLSRLVITFLPRSKRLLISWLQSPSAVILEPRKIKFDTVSPSISHEVMGPDAMIFVF